MSRVSFPGYVAVPTGVAGTGEAFLLQGGDKPLSTIMRSEVQAQKRQQAAAAHQQKQAEQEAQELQKLRAGIATDGFLPYHNELAAGRQQVYADLQSIYQNPGIDRPTKSTLAIKRLADYNSRVEWSNQVGERFKEIVRLSGTDKRYSPAAVDAALYASLKDKNGNVLSSGTFNPDSLTTVLDNPDTFDKTVVASKFLEELAKADTSTTSTAALPGRMGQRNTATSNFFEVENGVLKLDPVTGQRIARTDRPEVIEAARRDPFVSKLINQQMQAHADTVDGLVEKMRNLEPLTEQEQQLVAQEQAEPKRYATFLQELLLPHAYQRTSELQTYARPIVPKTPKAAPKPSSTEVTVTPTVGYQASTYTPEATGRFQQMKRALGVAPTPTTNHYPTVGVTFGNARRPYAEVTVDNRGAQVVGQDGKTTTLALGNAKVPMQVVSRDLVLYVNGKRLGQKQAFPTDADAYTYLLRTIEGLTPEQASKAELRAEYRGTLTDKARTANDGAGNATPTAAPTTNGIILPPTGAKASNSGPTETRLSVIAPATQATDAQLQRASGGKWNPRQPTSQQARAMEALIRKGGRVVTPYGTTAAPTRGAAGQTVGTNDVLGFGGRGTSPTNPKRGGAY